MTVFQTKVWKVLENIPTGKVATYQEVAKAAGSPRAARAVGNACNQNPFAPQVPCHRVVAANGKIGGYAQGVNQKIKLLQQEGINVTNGKIVDFESKRATFSSLKGKR